MDFVYELRLQADADGSATIEIDISGDQVGVVSAAFPGEVLELTTALYDLLEALRFLIDTNRA